MLVSRSVTAGSDFEMLWIRDVDAKLWFISRWWRFMMGLQMGSRDSPVCTMKTYIRIKKSSSEKCFYINQTQTTSSCNISWLFHCFSEHSCWTGFRTLHCALSAWDESVISGSRQYLPSLSNHRYPQSAVSRPHHPQREVLQYQSPRNSLACHQRPTLKVSQIPNKARHLKNAIPPAARFQRIILEVASRLGRHNSSQGFWTWILIVCHWNTIVEHHINREGLWAVANPESSSTLSTFTTTEKKNPPSKDNHPKCVVGDG